MAIGALAHGPTPGSMEPARRRSRLPYLLLLPGPRRLRAQRPRRHPVFVAVALLAVAARRREGRLIGRHLAVYGSSGWLTQPEVAMLASLPGRRDARGWARRTGARGVLGHLAWWVFYDD